MYTLRGPVQLWVIRLFTPWVRSPVHLVLSLVQELGICACVQPNALENPNELLSSRFVPVSQSLRGENASCPCTILFNTSSLALDGAISGMGEIAYTASGTEVAVWSFDQVH